MDISKCDNVKSLTQSGFTSASSLTQFASSLRARAMRARELAGLAHDPEVAAKLESYARELDVEADGLDCGEENMLRGG